MLADPSLSDADRKRLTEEFDMQERLFSIEMRKRYSKDDFEALAVVGKGAFGEVRLVRLKDTGEVFAMKSLIKDAMIKKNQVGHVRSERNALVSSDNPWVVKLHYSFQDDDHLHLVMDFLPGGDLMTLLIKYDIFPESAVRFFAAEAVLAVQSVHDLGYIHRDLKPDNFLLDANGHLLLTDLGLCTKVEGEGVDVAGRPADGVEDTRDVAPSSLPPGVKYFRDRKLAFSTVGTPDYIAPEVLTRRGYGMEADWWSLGVILYECLIGYPPFFADDSVTTCRKILNWQKCLAWPREKVEHLSPACLDFVKRLMSSADSRLGRHGIDEIKGHPFFAGIDWDTLHDQPAPYASPLAKLQGDAIERLKGMPRANPEFAGLVATLTGNFDEFPDVVLDEGVSGGGGKVKRGGSKVKNEFVGYTFKRAKDGSGPVLSKGGSGAGGSGRARPGSGAGGGGAGAAGGAEGITSPPAATAPAPGTTFPSL